jgi:hypothetical protein
LIFDSIRLTWWVREPYFWFVIPLARVMLLISCLPFLGLARWWLYLGLNGPLYAIVMLVGIVTASAGVGIHLVLKNLIGQA